MKWAENQDDGMEWNGMEWRERDEGGNVLFGLI
jgi:hypothetical protein